VSQDVLDAEMPQPVIKRHVRISTEIVEVGQNPGKVDPSLIEFHPEVRAHRLADHRLIKESMVGDQRRLANILKEGQ